MREDTELRQAMDLSRPFPWEPWHKRALALVLAGAALLALGAWKLLDLIFS